MEVLSAMMANRTARAMAVNFSSIYAAVLGCGILLTRKPDAKTMTVLDSMVCRGNDAKRLTEDWWLKYAVFWVLCFGAIIGGQMYAWFDRHHYFLVCGGLAAPLLVQPLVYPALTGEEAVAWHERHCTRATVWIAIFSFIGNWWFTHYFYNVLEASYSMPAHDVNAVPWAMFLATHFYFTLYHALAAKALRCTRRLYVRGAARTLFETMLVLAMAYSTAFTESATISAYPCYSFKDVHSAYTLGSAFYGIYFIVSYPVFGALDEPSEAPSKDGMTTRSKGRTAVSSPSTTTKSLWAVCLEAMGAGMAVLMLLDVVRVALGMELHIPLARPCKTDPSLTCAPFTGTAC